MYNKSEYNCKGCGALRSIESDQKNPDKIECSKCGASVLVKNVEKVKKTKVVEEAVVPEQEATLKIVKKDTKRKSSGTIKKSPVKKTKKKSSKK